jgi:serine protease AprX|mmetsp:Transcript_14518/g.15699  ORF Transcript_14518/g.15699 Transcript_14518/m.15699 type:complete len:190 (-) Transcript_14518:2351-2920(-)
MVSFNKLVDGMYDGVAPNAKLSISSLGTPDTGLCVPSIGQLYGPGYAAGSRVHSNSWGSYFNGNGYYSDQDTDRYLFINQGASIFFAAGNAGNNGDGSKTVTIESCSKNVIAVGSSQTTLGSQDIGYVAFYSSKGPAYDQRIKPDLVSPGDSLLSAASAGNGQQTCNTIGMTGSEHPIIYSVYCFIYIL